MDKQWTFECQILKIYKVKQNIDMLYFKISKNEEKVKIARLITNNKFIRI